MFLQHEELHKVIRILLAVEGWYDGKMDFFFSDFAFACCHFQTLATARFVAYSGLQFCHFQDILHIALLLKRWSLYG